MKKISTRFNDIKYKAQAGAKFIIQVKEIFKTKSNN